MAVETLARRHLFTESDINFFQHNFLHDLESVIWMAVYFLYRQVPKCLASEKGMPLLDDLWDESYRFSAYKIDEPNLRTSFLFKPKSSVLTPSLKNLYKQVPEMGGFLEAVLQLRVKLTTEYEAVEASTQVVANEIEHWDVDSANSRM